jgi:hypothetical protein
MSFHLLMLSLISFSRTYSFHGIDLSLHSLNFFLGILIFWCYCEWYCFPDSSTDFLLCTEMLLIFMYWFYIMLLYWMCLWDPRVFWCSF